MDKRRLAIVDLTGCSGCEINLINLDGSFLDIFQEFEVTNWRMVQDERQPAFDIVFIEGFACNEEQEETLKEVREACNILVALGNCAVSGNIFSELNRDNYKECMSRVYGPGHKGITRFVRAVPKVVKVDHLIPGCPARLDKVQDLLDSYRGTKPRPPGNRRKIKIPDHVAKIEGHGSLQVDFAKGIARFDSDEGERLVEALVIGKSWPQAVQFYARICGICPVSHVLASLNALEHALEVKPRMVVHLLRRLYGCAQMIHSHLLHLFFMVLPSMTGRESAIRMSVDYPAEFHVYLNIKRVCERIFKVIGGSILHPATTSIGGFNRVPGTEELLALREEIAEALDEAVDLVRLVASFTWPTARSGAVRLALRPRIKEEYPLMGNIVVGDSISPFQAMNYREFIGEKIDPEAPAKKGHLSGQAIKTGALARIYHYVDRLAPLARAEIENICFEAANPYHNIPGQSIEVLHYLEEAAALVDRLVGEDLRRAVVGNDFWKNILTGKRQEIYPLRGVGAIEAPRGLLIHEILVNRDGSVANCNIIPPTTLNLSGLATETEMLLADNPDKTEEQKKRMLTELIRAVDPCITCAVH